MPRWFDNLGYSAAPGPTQPQVTRPSAAALGLTRASYFGYGYFGDNAGNVDAAKVRQVGNCLPSGTAAMVDIERWVAGLLTTDNQGNPVPSALRRTYQDAIVKTMTELRATGPGSTCAYMPYSSISGWGHPDNGNAWWTANTNANIQVMTEPVPGASNGIGSLFEIKAASVYRRYQNADVERRRIAKLGALMRAVYPTGTTCAVVNPRYSSTFDNPAVQYDLMPQAEMDAYLGWVDAANAFTDRAVWSSNLYGPEGTPASQRNAVGYAIVPGTTNTVNGEAWNANAGWWKAIQNRMRPAQYATIRAGGGVDMGGPRTR